MFYKFLKYCVRTFLTIIGIKTIIHNKHLLHGNGPLLLVANHPNSFFDAVVIAAKFTQPIHVLTRGDAFKKPLIRKLLKLINLIPIYRLSEGKQNLHLNNDAFFAVQSVLNNNGIVLIFIEGICVNKHQPQPFKKGAARIAFNALQANINLQIMCIGIGYSSLTNFPFIVKINANNMFYSNEINYTTDVSFYNSFNENAYNNLLPLISIPTHPTKKNGLAYFHYLIIWPLLFCIKKYTLLKTKNTVFYHSVLFALLLIFYPIYWLFFIFILCSLFY